MTFPREEDMGELVGERVYYEYVQWRVFKDLDDVAGGVNVLVLLGDAWTMISGADFKAVAERILPQLDG